ncbi:TetR/AcrR family transcriptional regulator [Undibacterium sp. TS12]|uniref:TetR/AcrR family transcriptional regulator n=1 Tax=Undibacterium sp. TS12 TaxID=2908202 RepID=UPI001F4CEEEA|nr:TetR/AcrR family transcriptional regulator [Undibacterium sp. TS12]MCH8620493.1 TetR/AcrR family transcriptional regulator [Undibacterium sp. TS12]
MPTRDHILEAADQLFYEHGFDNTSFADIADAVGISRGNFYYHFKSKDDILTAVIALRAEKIQTMLEQWDVEGGSPEERIRCFIRILITNRASIMMHGCPVGTLTSELAKLDHASQSQANSLFTLFRAWLTRQFVALGQKKDADMLAMHLLARSQGVATMANAFHDEAFIKSEVDQMYRWLAAVVAGKRGPRS